MSVTALVVGATGLVGRHLLELLLTDEGYGEVVVLARRAVEAADPGRKLRQHILDFEELGQHRDLVSADHVFCALGTTMRKAGSRDVFRRVDLEYPLEIARAAHESGATHFSLVSALGADPRSRVFYSRVKGEVEEEIRALGFRSLAILRPSVIGGKRGESRPAEWVSKGLLRFAPRHFRTVPASAIAKAMVRLAVEGAPGVRIVESKDIVAHAGGRHGRA